MKFIKFFFVLGLILLNAVFAYSQTNLFLFWKGNLVQSSGTEDDYKPGENDFPIASSYRTHGFGLGVAFDYGPAFLGIEAHYNLSGKTILTDPSDNDTVQIDTYKSVLGFFFVGFNILRNDTMRFYLSVGGGVSYALDAEKKIYTSENGFETEIEVPDKKYPLAGFGGVGIELYLSSSIGLFINGRYQYIALDDPQKSVSALAGFIFSF